MEDGVIESRITKAVVQGEARVGKTSTKCMLVAEKYDSNRSTSCIESPCVAVKCYGHSGKWERYNEEKMEIAVISEIRSHAKKKKSIEICPPPESNAQDIAQLETTNKSPSVGAQPITRSTTESATQKEAVRRGKLFLAKCNESIEEDTRLIDQRWLYFIDSGGQMQFQKLLPAFMPYASVLFLVVSLAKNLFDRASTIMQLPEEEVNDGVNSLSIAEMLKQILSAIASSAQHYRSLIANDPILSQCIKPPSDKLRVLPIATHRDKYDEALKEGKESVDVKIAMLNEILMCHNTCEVIEHDGSLHFYEIDGREACKSDHEIQDIQTTNADMRRISQAIEDNAYEVKVPLKWYCYGILLNDVAKEGCGVLKLSYCQELGQAVSLSPEESLSAIKFQSLLNKLFYFPDSPAKDLVFVNVESLIDIIRDLVVFIYRKRPELEKKSLMPDSRALVAKGQLSIKILKKISKRCSKISESFPDFEIKVLQLFEYLLIAARLPDDDLFLMPALLPIKEESSINPFPDSVPLLLYFKKALPIGLFCAVIVHLISHVKNPWKIDEMSNFSNYFKLRCSKLLQGSVVLVEKLDYIALYCQSPSEDYIIARDALEEAVVDAMSKHNLSKNDKPSRAFHCPCKKGMQHIAIAEWFERLNHYNITCTIDEDFKVDVKSDEDFVLTSQKSERSIVFLQHHDSCIVGTNSDEEPDVIKSNHSSG